MVVTASTTDLLGRIRDENLNVYRASSQRLREDVGQENQIAQDYRGRLIYELLQNADDAMAGDDAGSACDPSPSQILPNTSFTPPCEAAFGS